MKNNLVRKTLLPLLSLLAVLVFLSIGLIHTPDRWVQDALYPQRGVPSPEIMIIGLDEETLAELGPYGPSYRSVIAYALERLASDPDRLPAAVAVDVAIHVLLYGVEAYKNPFHVPRKPKQSVGFIE